MAKRTPPKIEISVDPTYSSRRTGQQDDDLRRDLARIAKVGSKGPRRSLVLKRAPCPYCRELSKVNYVRVHQASAGPGSGKSAIVAMLKSPGILDPAGAAESLRRKLST